MHAFIGKRLHRPDTKVNTLLQIEYHDLAVSSICGNLQAHGGTLSCFGRSPVQLIGSASGCFQLARPFHT